MVGRVQLGHAARARGRRQRLVGRNRRAVGDGRAQARIVGAAVAVDHQARIAALDQRAAEAPGKMLGDGQSADVPRDVAVPFRARHTHVAEGARHLAPGMVAQQNERRRPFGRTREECGKLVGFEKRQQIHGSRASIASKPAHLLGSRQPT